jgi:hypothetical protein
MGKPEPQEKRTKACAAPKCRHCGTAEWNHRCMGPLNITEITAKAASAGSKKKKAKR